MGFMKTAISLPGQAADRFDRIAQKHGVTRSEFCRRAAEQYADNLTDAALTSQIDEAIDVVGQPGEQSAELRRVAGRSAAAHRVSG